MKRFNSFNMIHKGLRAMLYDCALTLQQTYFPDEEAASGALQKIRDAVFMFEKHGDHEDNMMMPPIKGIAPSLVASFEQEHVEDHALGKKLLHLINIFLDTRHDEERIIAGSALTQAFSDFMIFNLVHMSREEMEINPVLWENYSDAELMAINAEIVAGISEEEKELSAKWMLQGANKQESKEWMMAIRNTAPAFVFERLFQISNVYLPERFKKEVQQFVVNGVIVEKPELSGAFAS